MLFISSIYLKQEYLYNGYYWLNYWCLFCHFLSSTLVPVKWKKRPFLEQVFYFSESRHPFGCRNLKFSSQPFSLLAIYQDVHITYSRSKWARWDVYLSETENNHWCFEWTWFLSPCDPVTNKHQLSLQMCIGYKKIIVLIVQKIMFLNFFFVSKPG